MNLIFSHVRLQYIFTSSLQEKKILQFFQTKSTTRKTSYHIQTWVISPPFQLFIRHYIQPWEILSKAMNAAFPISKFQQFFIGYPDSITLYCVSKFHSHVLAAAGCHLSSSIWFIFFQIIRLIYLFFWFRKWVALLLSFLCLGCGLSCSSLLWSLSLLGFSLLNFLFVLGMHSVLQVASIFGHFATLCISLCGGRPCTFCIVSGFTLWN